MNRNITGTIKKTDGTVWAGAVVEFELERSSYDEQSQYPVKPVRAVADDDGEVSVSLWINSEAPRPTRYICTLPDGSQFRFTLIAGSGAADLSALRENAVEDDSPTQSDLIAFLPVLRSEANQAVENGLDEVNAQLDLKANKKALENTNLSLQATADAVSDLANTVSLKADIVALNTAIDELQDAITQAQSTLQDLIDQKAELVHTHPSGEILSTVLNSVAFFDGDGELNALPYLTFTGTRLGLGTSEPEATLDLSHPAAAAGNQARITADLDDPRSVLKLIADPSNPQLAAVSLDCGGVINSIESDNTGTLSLGTEGITPLIGFRMATGNTYFMGYLTGDSEPSTDQFPEPGCFGFYRVITLFDGSSTYFVLNDHGVIKTIAFR